jgi:hypothetical protein
MSTTFDSVEQAMLALADPAGGRWGEAFGFLAEHPETAALMLETFAETLAQMGVEPGAVDAAGEPVYTLADVARALGIAEADLQQAVTPPPGAGLDV